jgi:hypothetical protein
VQHRQATSLAVRKQFFASSGAGGAKPDVKTLERLLDEHKGKLDVNTTEADGGTALGVAAINGHADVVSALLRRGADVNKYSRAASIARGRPRPCASGRRADRRRR